MASAIQSSRDWLRSPRTNLLAWRIPQAAMLGGLFIAVPARTVIWIIALIWMGTACILNARRCGRTHCRYTGPYYLAMVAPVIILASGIVSAGFYGWFVLGVLILAGSKIVWWVTERAWGKFSDSSITSLASAHTSSVGRYCCKTLFALVTKNSPGCRRDFRVKMWGTSSPDDKLTGDLRNEIEATQIGGFRSDRVIAGKLAPGSFGLLQQYRH
jgi:hypothetical protein